MFFLIKVSGRNIELKVKFTCEQKVIIARSLGLHYNQYARPSVRGQLVKMLITLERHGISNPILHTYLF